MRCKNFVNLLILLLSIVAMPAWGMEELSENELDQVVAGRVSTEFRDDSFNFRFGDDKGGLRSIDGSGSLDFSSNGSPYNLGALILRDSAQSQLRSFISINAVNSVIKLLLNLNVNIHSSVGTVRQVNLSRDF